MIYRKKLRNNELEIDKQTNLGEEGRDIRLEGGEAVSDYEALMLILTLMLVIIALENDNDELK